MGDFLEDLGKRITETAEAVSKKTGEVVETQKMKNQIRLLERDNNRDFREMGKLIYEKFKQGEVLDETFAKDCKAVEEREEAIAEYLKEIANLQGKDLCPTCKNHLEPDMLYCPKCGTKVEEDIFEKEDVIFEDIFEETEQEEPEEEATADEVEAEDE